MNQENDKSRRQFLTKGAVAVSTVLIDACADTGHAIASAEDAVACSVERPPATANVHATPVESSLAAEGFSAFRFSTPNPDISHTVFVKGDGNPVLLMHELPGLTRQCIGFADELASRHFRVFMPLFFGEPNQDASVSSLAKLCISREFQIFSRGGTSPIATWMRDLCRSIRTESGGDGVGVIGMCLTGNFAIGLLADDAVLAAIASQPALPFGFGDSKAAIDVEPSCLRRAQRRVDGGARLMYLRFSEDCISPPDRLEAIRRAFPKNVKYCVIDSGPDNTSGIARNAHSVLTGNFVDTPGHPTRRARDEVIAFLRDAAWHTGAIEAPATDDVECTRTGRSPSA